MTHQGTDRNYACDRRVLLPFWVKVWSLFFFFLTCTCFGALRRCPTISLCVLVLWLLKPADLSSHENLFSLFAPGNHASICDMDVPVLTETHTLELMTWLWRADRSICWTRNTHGGAELLAWDGKGGSGQSLNKLKPLYLMLAPCAT